MLYFGFIPIAFDVNGNFKTHRLSRMWLKKLDYTIKNEHYVLSGQTPQGNPYEAHYDKKGQFLFVTVESWAKANVVAKPFFSAFISYVKKTVTAGGQELIRKRDYRVNQSKNRSKWPEDLEKRELSKYSPLYLPQEVSRALTQQGFMCKPYEITVTALNENLTSQLNKDDIAGELRIANKNDDVPIYELENPKNFICLPLPQVHRIFWRDLHLY